MKTAENQGKRLENRAILTILGLRVEAFGPRKLPQDVLSASKRPGRRWAELLEVFFRSEMLRSP